MWINSALGKWDQDARVKSALRDAEQRRLAENAQDPGEGALIARLVSSASGRLRGPEGLGRRVVDATRSWLGIPLDPQDQCC